MTGRDGIPQLPSVDLDAARDDASLPTDTDEPEPRRSAGRVLAAALALAVAFTLGVVVHDARRTASAEQDVAFVAGAPYRGTVGNTGNQREVRVNLPLVNTGTAPARIVGLEIRGFDVTGEIDLDAEPGQWSVIRTAVVPDCDRRAGRTYELTVETPRGRSQVTAGIQAVDNGLSIIWGSRCDALAVFQTLQTTGATVVSIDGDHAVTSVPVRTDMVEDVLIQSVASQTNGLSAVAAGLPTTLVPPRVATMHLTWTVTDCAMAQQMTELRAGATIEIPEREIPPTTTTLTLPTEALVSMVRFVEEQCTS